MNSTPSLQLTCSSVASLIASPTLNPVDDEEPDQGFEGRRPERRRGPGERTWAIRASMTSASE